MRRRDDARLHGGRLIARRLKAHGVTKLFTLSGGHLFSIYDGCREEGIDIVDVRHEATAAFAAEGWAKVTREPGVAALTAGPGRDQRHERDGVRAAEPLADGRARRARARRCAGARARCRRSTTCRSCARWSSSPRPRARRPRSRAWSTRPARSRGAPHTGPGVPGLPARRRVHGGRGAPPAERPRRRRARRPTAAALDRAAALLRDAERPVIMAGTNLYWGHGEQALRALAEAARRAGVPQRPRARLRARRPSSFFSRARKRGAEGRRRRARRRRADGLPARLRRRVRRGDRDRRDRPRRARARPPARGRGRALRRHRRRRSARSPARRRPTRAAGSSTCAAIETEKREAEREQLSDDRAPLHPMRVYGELAQVLDRDAIVIGDGGDFVSYAGRVVDSYEPGCWLDPGPFGCLGSGPGYALAAKLAHPERQVVLLLGDGAFGFSRDGVRHARPPRRQRRRRDGQQRHLGAREAPDGVPLRLLGGRRAAPGDALRRRWSRRSAATASWCARRPSCGRRWSARSRRASRRWSTC